MYISVGWSLPYCWKNKPAETWGVPLTVSYLLQEFPWNQICKRDGVHLLSNLVASSNCSDNFVVSLDELQQGGCYEFCSDSMNNSCEFMVCSGFYRHGFLTEGVLFMCSMNIVWIGEGLFM